MTRSFEQDGLYLLVWSPSTYLAVVESRQNYARRLMVTWRIDPANITVKHIAVTDAQASADGMHLRRVRAVDQMHHRTSAVRNTIESLRQSLSYVLPLPF
jgi:hypothetical protein